MLLLLRNLAVTLLLMAGLALPGPAFGLQVTNLAEAQQKYDKSLTERSRLLERLEQLEDRYQGLVRKIDELKSGGAMSSIGGRLELQNLLTQSKSLADELDGLQNQLRGLDNELSGQRSTLVSGIDRRVSSLESSLARASTSERKAIVAELNALRRRRGAYTTPLPTVPSNMELSSTLRLAEEAAHPDELMAAADELQDTEDQLRKRLSAINTKLGELRKSRTLVRRARSFSREERFFEETDRDRVIARYERETRTARPTSDDGDASPTAGSNEQSGNLADPGNNATADDFAANDGFAEAPASQGDFDSEPEARGDADITDSPTGAPVASDPPPSAEAPFETSRETIVIDGGGDPDRGVGSLGGSASSLDGQIRGLEMEQEKLEKQANKLRKRARELREKAADM